MFEFFSEFSDEYTAMEFLEYVDDIDTPLRQDMMMNALHISANYAEKNVFKYCLERKANPNKPCVMGNTPILLVFRNKATSEVKAEMVKELLEKGADINTMYPNGTALRITLETNNCGKIVDVILRYNPELNELDGNGSTPLYAYLRKGDAKLNILRKLLKKGSNPNIPGVHGQRALHIWMNSLQHDVKSVEITELLIEFGANVNERDSFGKTALFYAVEKNQPKLVKCLLKNNADMSIVDKMGKTVFAFTFEQPFENRYILSFLMKCLVLQEQFGKIYLSVQLKRDINRSGYKKGMYKKYKNEAVLLKRKIIPETNTSYLQIMVSNSRIIAHFARNSRTRHLLENFRGTKFTTFGNMVQSAIRRGLKRRELEDFLSTSDSKKIEKPIDI